MAKTNKQLQAEIDKLTIEKNNLVDMLEIAEKGIRGVSKILGLEGISENTYFNDADIETIEKAIEKLQGKYEKCFEELSMKCGECEGLLKANETIVKAHNDLEHENKRLSDLLHLYDNKDWKEHSEEQKIKELELDKKDLHKRLIEGLQINIEKVEKIGELENKVDEQFKVITKYEKELEEQDKEIEELKEENKNQKEEIEWQQERIEELNKEVMNSRIIHKDNVKERGKQLKEVRKQLSKKQNTIVLSNKQNQDLFDALQKELQSQIILKNTYKKENKRLKKRRREGRYNIDKFITNLTKGAYVYVEGASRPTKLHKRLRDAIAEKQRLEKKTNKKVYILTNL